jgi:hypothetical protein
VLKETEEEDAERKKEKDGESVVIETEEQPNVDVELEALLAPEDVPMTSGKKVKITELMKEDKEP